MSKGFCFFKMPFSIREFEKIGEEDLKYQKTRTVIILF